MTTPPRYDPNTGLPYGQGQQPGSPYGQEPWGQAGYGQPGNGQPYGPPQPGGYSPSQPGPFGQPGPIGRIGRGNPGRQRGVRLIVTGSILFVVGLLITIVTLGHAESSTGGGTYIVAWGPMVFGIIAIIRGLLALSRAGRFNR